MHDPERTIPRAIAPTIGIAIALFLAVAQAAVGTVGSERLGAEGAPIAVAAAITLGPGFALAVRLAAVTAMLGVILSQLLGLSRMLFAMARRGDTPGGEHR